jgi:hypothetical protein
MTVAGAIALVVGALLARAASAAPEEPAPPPAPAPTEAGEVPKLECFSRHEQAQAARRERHLLQARDDLQICSSVSCPAAIRADCVDWLAEVGRSLPSVVVTARAGGVDEPEVKVFIDGQLVAERLSGGAIDVDPGEHRFRFESPRWPPIERAILVSEGVKDRSIDVELAPSPEPAAALQTPGPRPAAPERHLQRIDYVVGGLGLASLGTSAVLGGWGLVQGYRFTHGGCAPFCSTAQKNDVQSKLVAADVALGVAVACAVVVYAHVARSGQPTAAAAVSSRVLWPVVQATPNGGGLGLGGAF